MGKSYEFYIKTMKSIGFTYRIPRYITDRQNYIGFTYKGLVTYLYLFIYLQCNVKLFCQSLTKAKE